MTRLLVAPAPPYSLAFQSEPNRKYRMHAMHERAAAVNYSNHRSVYGQFSFPPGRYIVIPTTYECELEAEFTLRIFSSSRLLCEYVCVVHVFMYVCEGGALCMCVCFHLKWYIVYNCSVCASLCFCNMPEHSVLLCQ